MDVSHCMVCKSVRVNFRPYRRKTIQKLACSTLCIFAVTLCIAIYLPLNIGLSMKGSLRISYCMVCKSVREDNPRALAS